MHAVENRYAFINDIVSFNQLSCFFYKDDFVPTEAKMLHAGNNEKHRTF
jgi:hypothetical protein